MNTADTIAATPDVNEMTVVHRAFRREFTAIPRLVREVAAGDLARAEVVADHVDLLLAGLHLHHAGEDAVLWPLLRRRASPSTGLVETMEAQHGRVEERVARVERAVAVWRAHPDAARGEECATAVEALAADLVEHLDLEEREILPLVTAHITVAEWKSLGEHGKDAMSPRQLPLMFGAVLEEADPAERARMLANLPVAVRWFLVLVGAPLYRRHITRVRGS